MTPWPHDSGNLQQAAGEIKKTDVSILQQPVGEITLILCKTRKKTIAEYALRDLAKPVGVARYVTRLVESLPEQLAGSLPSIEQIEAEFATESAGGKPANNARTPRRRRR